jgi:tRNA (guanine-N7-)-methyltransferase
MAPVGNAIYLVIELVPESYTARLDLEKTFGRIAPLHVDLGCGDGSFLITLAERHPETNFLGIERMAGRVAKVCRKAARIDNMRVLHLESSYAVRYLIPENSVEFFYLLFPDPWPKRRHQRRRLMTPEFLESIHRALLPGGLLQLATDERDYFEQMRCLAQENLQFEIDQANDSRFAKNDLPSTKFECRFQQKGVPIYRLALRKVSPVM